MYSIEQKTLQNAANERYCDIAKTIEVTAPYWVDEECVRVGIRLDGDIAFGANFYYKEGIFR